MEVPITPTFESRFPTITSPSSSPLLRTPMKVFDAYDNDVSTSKGIIIGMLSALGSAVFVAFVFALIYFLRNTDRGRILLDRMGRPGQYDDEQAMLIEEAEALETMDDITRAEYLRAKGRWIDVPQNALSGKTGLSY